MGNQAERNAEDLEARAEGSTWEAAVRRNREEKERKKQRLSSQNPKLKQTKECENSGGQKVERKRVKPWNGQPREARNEAERWTRKQG